MSTTKVIQAFEPFMRLLEQENSTSPVAPLLDGDKEIEKYLDIRHSSEEMTLDPSDYLIQKRIDTFCFFPVPSSILCTRHE